MCRQATDFTVKTMRIVNTKEIEEKIYLAALKAGINLTADCENAICRAYGSEENQAAKFALQTIIKNAETAKAERMPVCQDTGMAVVILQIGQEVFLEGKLLTDAVNDGVRRAYADGYFRKSVCDPLTRENTGDNTPAVIHTEIVLPAVRLCAWVLSLSQRRWRWCCRESPDSLCSVRLCVEEAFFPFPPALRRSCSRPRR